MLFRSPFLGASIPAYIAIYSFLLNIGLAVVLSLVFNAAKKHRADETEPSDYYALEGIGGGGH